MDKHRKLLLQILQGRSDANIPFDDLCRLLVYLGFEERIRGGHHIFRRPGIEDKVNLQREATRLKSIKYARSGIFY